MTQRFSNLDWKILVGICFLLLFFIVTIGFVFNSPNNNSSNTIPIIESQFSPSPNTFRQKYQTADFSISYPPNVSVYSQNLGSGSSLVFRFSSRPDVNMDLEFFRDASHTQAALSTIFKSLNYQESDLLVAQNPAKKFTGTLVMRDKTLQETAIIFQNKDTTYKFQINYNGSTKDVELENLFLLILSQLKFT